MDIQKIISDLLGKLKVDDKLVAQFKKDPVATVKSLLGNVDLNNDQVKAVADGLSAKLKLDGVAGALSGLFGNK